MRTADKGRFSSFGIRYVATEICFFLRKYSAPWSQLLHKDAEIFKCLAPASCWPHQHTRNLWTSVNNFSTCNYRYYSEITDEFFAHYSRCLFYLCEEPIYLYFSGDLIFVTVPDEEQLGIKSKSMQKYQKQLFQIQKILHLWSTSSLSSSSSE